MKKKIEIVTKYFLSVLTGLVIVSIFFALYGLFQVAVLDKSYASYFGYSLFEVESGSMSPTINVKDMVVVKKTKDIKKNDIITYNIDGSFITHRAVDVQKNKIIAKGDFNNYEDKTIPRNTVIGKVVKVFPKFGVWKKIMLSPIVLIAVFFTMLLFGLGLSYEDKKNADKRGLFRKRKQEEFDNEPKTLFERVKDFVFSYKKKEKLDEDLTDEIEEKVEIEEVSESVDETLSRETLDIHVKTEWSDNDNQDGIRPNSITIKVMNGDSVVETKEITEKDNWSYTFKGLCKYEDNYEGDSNHIIKYAIDEVLISGYKKTIAGFNVTNTHTPKKTNISGKVVWNDDNVNSRPEVVNVKLMKNGVLVESKKVTKNNDWKYTFINLYKFEKGVEAKYTIEEELVTGYTSNVSGYDVINTHKSSTKQG